MWEEDKNKIINNVKATMAVENQNLDNTDLQLLQDFAEDRISMEDAMSYIKEITFGKV